MVQWELNCICILFKQKNPSFNYGLSISIKYYASNSHVSLPSFGVEMKVCRPFRFTNCSFPLYNRPSTSGSTEKRKVQHKLPVLHKKRKSNNDQPVVSPLESVKKEVNAAFLGENP